MYMVYWYTIQFRIILEFMLYPEYSYIHTHLQYTYQLQLGQLPSWKLNTLWHMMIQMKYRKNYSFLNKKIIFGLIFFWVSVICNPNCNFDVKRELYEYELCVCVWIQTDWRLHHVDEISSYLLGDMEYDIEENIN